MNDKKTIPTTADLDAILPALRAIASTTPFGFARFWHDNVRQHPEVSIGLPVPSTSFPITIEGRVVSGSEWKVKVSGGSWEAGSVDEIRTTTAVMTVAQNLACLLLSIRPTR